MSWTFSGKSVATRYPEGHEPKAWQPGDIVVARATEDALTQLIQGGERVRYGNVDATRWDHSLLIVDASGGIVEANAGGVEYKNISEYKGTDYMVISPIVSNEARVGACAFMHAWVGVSYDVLDFVGLAAQCLFNSKLSLHVDGRFICSGLVSRATERYTVSYPRSPEAMMPADLVVFYGADSGEPLIPLSFFARFLDRLKSITRAIF